MGRFRWLKISSIIVENCLYEHEIRGKNWIVSILYRCYELCSQSLQVWSTQGWHVWAIHIWNKRRLYLSHCVNSKNCVMSIKLFVISKVFFGPTTFNQGLQLFEVVGPDVQQLFRLSRWHCLYLSCVTTRRDRQINLTGRQWTQESA